ncbi:MAG: malate synthase A, partial [Myxococcota bacterium]
ICRAQIWQWVHHGAALDDGTPITAALVRDLTDDVVAADTTGAPTLRPAADLFVKLCTAETLAPFLTTEAYALARPMETV